MVIFPAIFSGYRNNTEYSSLICIFDLHTHAACTPTSMDVTGSWVRYFAKPSGPPTLCSSAARRPSVSCSNTRANIRNIRYPNRGQCTTRHISANVDYFSCKLAAAYGIFALCVCADVAFRVAGTTPNGCIIAKS